MKFTEFCDLTKKYPNERVQVFIDQGNLYKAIEKVYDRRDVDPTKIALKLVGGRKLVRINIYVSLLNPEWEPKEAKAQQRFVFALQGIPFVTLQKRPLHYSQDRKRKWEKGIDVLLATDMFSQAYHHSSDSIILVSGDGDYAPVLEEVKKFGLRIENSFLAERRSNALRSVSDIFIKLDEVFLTDCLIEKSASQKL